MKSNYPFFLFIIFAWILLICTGCRPLQEIDQGSQSSSPSEKPPGQEDGPSEPEPPAEDPLISSEYDFTRGTNIQDCLNSRTPEANACIFHKNPIADRGGPLRPSELPLINIGDVYNDLIDIYSMNSQSPTQWSAPNFLATHIKKEGSAHPTPLENTQVSKEAFPGILALTGIGDPSSIQNYAVKIPETSLSSNTFQIRTLTDIGSPIDIPMQNLSINNDGNWKYAFPNDPNLTLTYIHTTYWLHQIAIRIKGLTGNFYPEGHGLNVEPLYVVEFFAFEEIIWVPGIYSNASWLGGPYKTLSFGVSNWSIPSKRGGPLHIPLGLDTSLIAHELGHALLEYASEADINYNRDLEGPCHIGEDGYEYGICSKSLSGSPFAIGEGVGDILSIFLFPNSTPIAEMLENSVYGTTHCSQTRDVAEIKKRKLSAQDLFDACKDTDTDIDIDFSGEIHAVGSIYSTIWYGLFQKAFERGGESKREDAYKLFFEHLKNITSEDTFDSIRLTIKALDKQLFERQFSEDLDAQYESLGYAIIN